MSTSNKPMTYTRLGASGLKVSRIILGLMSYGTPDWQGWVLNEEEGLKHIKAAYDAGIQTFDTANMYSNGLSEVILGKAIKKFNLPRDEIVVMTKVNFPVGKEYSIPSTSLPGTEAELESQGYTNQFGLSRKHIFESIKRSLERLQLDYVDVLQCHRFDYNTPIAETMQALHDVVQAGYARYIGMSSCYAYQFHAMQNYAIANKLTPFISMQNYYNLIYREEEREMIPTLKANVRRWINSLVTTRPRSPDPASFSTISPGEQRSQTEAESAIINRVEALAAAKGVSMAQISIAWVLSKDPVAAPIVGTTSLKNLDDILGAIHVKLTEEEIKSLEEPYQPQSITGHWYINAPFNRVAPEHHIFTLLCDPWFNMSTTTTKTMTYTRLGASGLKVSRIILGLMSYGTPDWQGWVLNEEEGLKHIKAAYDAGIQTFDTANMYSNGLSEVILGKAIKQFNLPRDEIVVLTKVYFPVGKEYSVPSTSLAGGDPELESQGYTNQFGLSRKHIFDSIKRSLGRLQLDYVDVLQCHRFDYNTPIAETMQALHDLLRIPIPRHAKLRHR
ncbi:unnamed protein product [Rhizoctonia solani]|uniref:NADP-dependent oxidoreductase domain-containing protein n=1 Tax=Rhizoctonia solani TaxID=456999 RepID=A0A8H3GU95_9AGAM|nr:unnamed protein product [Rhizoctonia solani]